MPSGRFGVESVAGLALTTHSGKVQRYFDSLIQFTDLFAIACAHQSLQTSRGTVRMLSRLATHGIGKPCARPRGTSAGNWRTVRVTIATTIPPMFWRTA